MSKIMVIIPTYNHPEMINDILYQTIDTYNGELFEFEIHDGSTNNNTQEIIENYNKESGRIVKYCRYNSSVSLDEKVKIAIENNRLNYFMLLGDGNLIDFNNLDLQLLSNNFDKYQVVNLESITRKEFNNDLGAKLNEVMEYDDPVVYSKYYSHLTYFGGAVYNTDFIRGAFDKRYYKECRKANISWWLSLSIFNQFVDYRKDNKCTVCANLYVDGLDSNPKKKDHSWADKERYFVLTFELFNMDVSLLYSDYNAVKKTIVKSFRDDSLASRRYLIQKRINKDINIKLVRKYKRDIKCVHGYYGFMIFICLIPVFLLKMAKKLYKTIKR